MLRPTRLAGIEPLECWNLRDRAPARVSLVAGAAGPIGGDNLRLTIEVASGASLVLRNVAATLALPGPHGQPSCTETTIHVAAGATFVWLPGLVIAAKGCDHYAFTHVLLEAGARFLLREELLLGRHGEQPGSIRQRLRVCLDSQVLHDQALAIGPRSPGWDGPAVTGGRRALGSALIVDPTWEDHQLRPPLPSLGTDTALLPASGPAMLVTAIAHDGLALRRQLDAGMTAIDSLLVSAVS